MYPNQNPNYPTNNGGYFPQYPGQHPPPGSYDSNFNVNTSPPIPTHGAPPTYGGYPDPNAGYQQHPPHYNNTGFEQPQHYAPQPQYQQYPLQQYPPQQYPPQQYPPQQYPPQQYPPQQFTPSPPSQQFAGQGAPQGAPTGTPQSVADSNEFSKILEGFKKQKFSKDQVNYIKNEVMHRAFTTDQMSILLKAVAFSSAQEEIAVAMYPAIIDRANFHRALDVIKFSSTKKKIKSMLGLP